MRVLPNADMKLLCLSRPTVTHAIRRRVLISAARSLGEVRFEGVLTVCQRGDCGASSLLVPYAGYTMQRMRVA